MDHIVTRNGKAGKAWMVSNDNRGGAWGHPRTQPSSVQPGYSPSLDPDSDTFITWADSLGRSVGVIPYGEAVSLPLHISVAESTPAQLKVQD